MSKKYELLIVDDEESITFLLRTEFEDLRDFLVDTASNGTEAINLASHSLASRINKGDEIVISQMEHHSNLVPWQQLAKQKGADFKQIRITDDGELDIGHAQQLITPKTKITTTAKKTNPKVIQNFAG